MSALLVKRLPRTVLPPLSRAMWGAVEPAQSLIVPLSNYSEPPVMTKAGAPAKVTTLANGFKVASCEMTGPATTVGVYVETGSKFETVPGTAHVLQHMAFKSSTSKSALMMVRDAEMLGAAVSCTTGRENMVYQVDTLTASVPAAVAMLAETTLRPKLLAWELQEAGSTVEAEASSMKANHMALVQELMHPAAYGAASPLGKPLMAKPSSLGDVDPSVLGDFVSTQFVPEKMVLAAAGYDHDELVSLAKKYFGGLPKGGAAAAPPKDSYVGGEVRLLQEEKFTHFAIGFEGTGWKDADLVPLCVLNTLMGGGTSFSAGGPGKGMYTRLYQNVLNKLPFVQAASVFNSFYNETGVFGVYGAAPASEMGSLVSALLDELKKMKGAISAVELARAKVQLKASLLMNLESRPVLFEDIGRQMLTYGARTEPEALVKQIEAVTAADLTKVATKLLKSPPSIVVVGDTTAVPRYDIIAKALA